MVLLGAVGISRSSASNAPCYAAVVSFMPYFLLFIPKRDLHHRGQMGSQWLWGSKDRVSQHHKECQTIQLGWLPAPTAPVSAPALTLLAFLSLSHLGA